MQEVPFTCLLKQTNPKSLWEKKSWKLTGITSKSYLIRVTLSDLSELATILEKENSNVGNFMPVIGRKVKSDLSGQG